LRKAAGEEVAAVAQPLQGDAHDMAARRIAPVDAVCAFAQLAVRTFERAPRVAQQRVALHGIRAPRISAQPAPCAPLRFIECRRARQLSRSACHRGALSARPRNQIPVRLGASQREAKHVPVARGAEDAHGVAQRTHDRVRAIALQKATKGAHRGEQPAHADAQLVQILGLVATRHTGRVGRDLRERGVAKRGKGVAHRGALGKQRA